MALHDRNYTKFRVERPPETARITRPVAVDKLLAKRAENMKMGQRQVKETQRQEEEALADGKLPQWWRSGLHGPKRVRLEEEEEPEVQPPRRKRRRK